MKYSLAIILAGFICIMMMTEGCTSTSSTKPVTTTATTGAVTPFNSCNIGNNRSSFCKNVMVRNLEYHV